MAPIGTGSDNRTPSMGSLRALMLDDAPLWFTFDFRAGINLITVDNGHFRTRSVAQCILEACIALKNSTESENAYDPEPVPPSNEISDFWGMSKETPKFGQGFESLPAGHDVLSGQQPLYGWQTSSCLCPKAHMARVQYLAIGTKQVQPAVLWCPKSQRISN